MKKLFAILAMAMAMASTTASAGFYTGNQLLRQFKANNYYSDGASSGYIVGVADARNNFVFCIPVGVTVGQLEQIVQRYMAANPEHLHEAADLVVTAAIISVFPCKGA